MIRDAINHLQVSEKYENALIKSKRDLENFEENALSDIAELGVGNYITEANSILDDILDALKKITDPIKLNRIYSFLFKDELSNSVREVLHYKGIMANNDIELITSWIVTADSTLKEKRDFIKQISKDATSPIISLDNPSDFKKFSGNIYNLESLIVNKHSVLENIIEKVIDWTPGGSSGGGAASAGPGEGMLKLLSFNALPISKGDVHLGKFVIEVKGNVKGNDGGALSGGKSAKGWKGIDAAKTLEKEFDVILGNLDLRLIQKAFESDWITALGTISRAKGGDNITNFRKAILVLSKQYFSMSGSNKSFKNFTSNLENINFDNMVKAKNYRDFFEIFCIYNLEYYKELENFDYVFLVQYTERKFTIIENQEDFLGVVDGLRIKPGDFKWDVAPGAFRLGLH